MEIIQKYFPSLTDEQINKFNQLQKIYSEWNSKINVISRKDIEHLYLHHVLHSLGIAKIIEFNNGTKIMDAGTGGGFPGIPLAILFPEAIFFLADSIGKKIKVVNNVAKELELDNVIAQQIRVEEVKEKFDFIVSRAVTSLDVFYNWIKTSINTKNSNNIPNGILYLKGGDLNEELKSLKKSYKIYNLNNFFTEDFFETKKVVHIFKNHTHG